MERVKVDRVVAATRVALASVGEAWTSGDDVLIRGQEVSDDTYRPEPGPATPGPRRGHRCPVRLVYRRRPLAGDEGFDAHFQMAQEVARVLVDLLQWFPD